MDDCVDCNNNALVLACTNIASMDVSSDLCQDPGHSSKENIVITPYDDCAIYSNG